MQKHATVSTEHPINMMNGASSCSSFLVAMSRSTSPASLLVFLLLLLSGGSFYGASATTIDVINNCPYPIWPGVQSNAGSITPEMSGFHLAPAASFPVYAPYSWSGRIWARTACSFDASTSNFSCATGGCASGAVSCNGFGPKPPVSLAQFNLGSSADGAMDYYGISLADGFNVPLKVAPMGFGDKSSDCRVTECASNAAGQCTLDNATATPHVCPTAKTPTFKLVFCPVPSVNSTTKHDEVPKDVNVTNPPPEGHPPVYVAPSPAPIMPRTNDTKELPDINITITSNSTGLTPTPAPAPVSFGRKGFVHVSSAGVSASTTWLLFLGAGVLMGLLVLALCCLLVIKFIVV